MVELSEAFAGEKVEDRSEIVRLNLDRIIDLRSTQLQLTCYRRSVRDDKLQAKMIVYDCWCAHTADERY